VGQVFEAPEFSGDALWWFDLLQLEFLAVGGEDEFRGSRGISSSAGKLDSPFQRYQSSGEGVRTFREVEREFGFSGRIEFRRCRLYHFAVLVAASLGEPEEGDFRAFRGMLRLDGSRQRSEGRISRRVEGYDVSRGFRADAVGKREFRGEFILGHWGYRYMELLFNVRPEFDVAFHEQLPDNVVVD